MSLWLVNPAAECPTPFDATGVVTVDDTGCGRECTLVGSGNSRVLSISFSNRDMDLKVSDGPKIDLVPRWLAETRVLSRILQKVVRSTCLDKFGELS